jgi:hypothetical protein
MTPIEDMDDATFRTTFEPYFSEKLFYTIWGALKQGVHLREIWADQARPRPWTAKQEISATLVDFSKSCFLKLISNMTKDLPRERWPAENDPIPASPKTLWDDLLSVRLEYENRELNPLPSAVDVPVTQDLLIERKSIGGAEESRPADFKVGLRDLF